MEGWKKMSQGIYSLEQIVTLKSEKEGEEERLPFKRISHLRMAHRIFFLIHVNRTLYLDHIVILLSMKNK